MNTTYHYVWASLIMKKNCDTVEHFAIFEALKKTKINETHVQHLTKHLQPS